MSRRPMVIGIEMAEFMAGVPLLEDEKRDILRLSQIQLQAEKAKEELVNLIKLRAAIATAPHCERN